MHCVHQTNHISKRAIHKTTTTSSTSNNFNHIHNTLEQSLYKRSLPKALFEKTMNKTTQGAFHYAQYQKQEIARKAQRTQQKGREIGKKAIISGSKTTTSTNINQINHKKAQKLLTMNKQRFLPVRQFDTLANNFYVNMAHYGAANGGAVANTFGHYGEQRVIGLLAPPQRVGVLKRIYNYLGRSSCYFWLKSCCGGINVIFKQRPLLWGTVFATIKSMVADAFAQTAIEGADWDDFNVSRNFLFGFVGMCFCFCLCFCVLFE